MTIHKYPDERLKITSLLGNITVGTEMNNINNYQDRALDESINQIAAIRAEIINKIKEFIVGNEDLIDLLLIALLSNEHILIEGAPGTAKTRIAKIISLIVGCDFKRIQGVIDIQPADMIGVRIYDLPSGEFELRKGPIFTNILLVDELNRINPKSQSAFIEALSEKHVTIDGDIYSLPSPFFVIATQNPYDIEGTFPLIEVQRDRFAFSTVATYLTADDELEVIQRASSGELEWEYITDHISPIIDRYSLLKFIHDVSKINMETPVHQYIRDIVMATRHHADIMLGVSSRASVAIVKGAKSMAALEGRKYVIPDDVKKLARYVLPHRINLTREAEIDNLKVDDVISEILEAIEVP